MKNFIVFLQLFRIQHYVKNLFIFAPLFFSGQLLNFHDFILTIETFIAFCFLASSVYIYNDLVDIEEDKHHPTKKYRPLTSGKIKKSTALISMLSLCLFSFLIISLINIKIIYLFIAYLLMNIAYTFRLKRLPLIDVTIVSIGFVIRLFIGSVTCQIELSHWIVIMTFLLALFLAFAKRRDDVLLVERKGVIVRKLLVNYNLLFLNAAISMTGAIVIIAYLMYAVSPLVIARVGSEYFYLTAIFVILGVMRYLQITFVDERSGSPTEIFLKDVPVQLSILAWIVSFVCLLYL